MAGTQRRRINDGGPTTRQAVQQRVLGNIGLRGLRMLGSRPAGQGLAVAGAPGALGARGGVVVHRMVVRAEPQTVDHDAGVVWRSPEGEPTPQSGFSGFSPPSAEIPIQVGGVLTAFIQGLWTEYRGGGDIELVRTRNGSTDVFVLEPGPITSRFWAGPIEAVDVRPGDTIELRPNHSGALQGLTSAELQLQIIVTDAATSDVPVPAACSISWDDTYVTPVANARMLSAVALDDGRVLAVWRDTSTDDIKQGYAASVDDFIDTDSSLGSITTLVTGHTGTFATVSKAAGKLWLFYGWGDLPAEAWIASSDDDGVTWDDIQQLGDTNAATTSFMQDAIAGSQVFETSTGTLVLGGPYMYDAFTTEAFRRFGIWRSTDGGATWTLEYEVGAGYANASQTFGGCTTFAQDADGTIVGYWSHTYGGSYSHRLTSTDDGDSWTSTVITDGAGYPHDGTIAILCDGAAYAVTKEGSSDMEMRTYADPADVDGEGDVAFTFDTVTPGSHPLITVLEGRLVLLADGRVYDGGYSEAA